MLTEAVLENGVNLIAPSMEGFGIGEAVLALGLTLDAAGIPYRRFDLNQDDLANLPFSRTIIHANPWQLIDDRVWPKLLPLMARREQNIGYWVWESLNTFRPAWLACANLFREIWTPSAFSNACLTRVMPIPVYTMPHAIRIPVKRSDTTARPLHRPFRLLTLFDPLSLAQRKNPEAALQAFSIVHERLEAHVSLTVKTRDLDAKDQSMLQDLLPSDAVVDWIDGHLSRAEYDHLIIESDAFISLHRSEGFGLAIAEAMAFGKPVIATGYSGNLEYMNNSNSILVPWTPICVATSQPFHFPKGTQWAQADVAYAALAIQSLALDSDFACRIGAAASSWISEYFSAQALARTMLHLLNRQTSLDSIKL